MIKKEGERDAERVRETEVWREVDQEAICEEIVAACRRGSDCSRF